MNAAKSLIYGGLSILAIGCSSSSDDADAPTVSLPPAAIDSQNAPVIASAVTKSAVENGDLGSFANLMGGGAVLGGPDGQVIAKIGSIQSNQIQAMRDRALLGQLEGPIPPQTTDCVVSGTVTVSGDIASPLTLSPNDTFAFLFTACDDGAGVVDGSYEMRITSFTGDLLGGSFSMAVSVTLTAFAVTTGEQAATVNGDLSVSMGTTGSPLQTITLTSTSLSVSDGVSSHTLANYSAVQTVDRLTGAYTLELSGALTSSAFSGSVLFETSVDLVGDGTGFAYAGEIRIVGAESATIYVVVLDADLVRLEIDLDGDGTIDEIIDTSWAELLV